MKGLGHDILMIYGLTTVKANKACKQPGLL